MRKKEREDMTPLTDTQA